jgi:ring-1,2-phenylacetyl-CoA epoxidase subunit PaaE
MSNFYPLKVKKVSLLTPESVSVTLEVPQNLKQEFSFKPGQFVMVEKELNGEKLRRYYSIYSIPSEKDIKLGIKFKDKDGFADYAMNHLKEGEILQVSHPMDDVKIDLQKENKKKYLAITVGSGITPFYSIIREMIKQEPQSRFVLIYGNRTPELTMFLKELRELQKNHPDQFVMYEVYTQSDEGNYRGRIDAQIIEDILNKEGADFDAVYLIGPDDLKKKAAQKLTESGIDKSKLHYRVYS